MSLSLATPVPVPAVGAERVLALGAAAVVDLRSPAEHAEDHLPGAVSVPLFDDEERALVGTLYHRASPDAAYEEARAIARGKAAELARRVAAAAGAELQGDAEARADEVAAGGLARMEERLAARADLPLPERPVVLYCWRGGLRSRSVAALVRALGLDRAVLLAGGYKAWRRHVIDSLARFDPPPAFVLRGLTGVGKTLVLGELERLRPGWTVDLEGLAGHRSSILGAVGLEPVSQRAFETRLHARLARGFPGGCAVLEGESRKVGDVVLPAGLWEAMERGATALLEAPLERRVEVLAADYLATERSRAELRARLPWLEERIGPVRIRGALVRLLDQDRIPELVELLLERWYDPRYRHSERGRPAALRIDATDPARAARELAGWIEDCLAA